MATAARLLWHAPSCDGELILYLPGSYLLPSKEPSPPSLMGG